MTAGIGATLTRVQSLISRFQGLATPGSSTEPSTAAPGYGLYRPSSFRPAPALPPVPPTNTPLAERRPALDVARRERADGLQELGRRQRRAMALLQRLEPGFGGGVHMTDVGPARRA